MQNFCLHLLAVAVIAQTVLAVELLSGVCSSYWSLHYEGCSFLLLSITNLHQNGSQPLASFLCKIYKVSWYRMLIVNNLHHHHHRQLVIASPVCQSKDFLSLQLSIMRVTFTKSAGTARASTACLDICTSHWNSNLSFIMRNTIKIKHIWKDVQENSLQMS